MTSTRILKGRVFLQIIGFEEYKLFTNQACRIKQISCFWNQNQEPIIINKREFTSSAKCKLIFQKNHNIIKNSNNNRKLTTKCKNVNNYNNVDTKLQRVDSRIYYQKSGFRRQINDDDDVRDDQKAKLVVLWTWLGAQEKHIKKYREFYLKRGFDVVNVNTTLIDILMPNYLARRNAAACVQFLINKQYERVFYHGFSIGALMFGQVLLDIDQRDPRIREKLYKSIWGIALDSAATMADFEQTFANSFTQNKLFAKILGSLFRAYKQIARDFAASYFRQIEQFIFTGPLKRPSLHIYSRGDNIIDYRNAQRLANKWLEAGIELDMLVVEDANHVQIFRKYPQDYITKLEKILKRVKLL